MYLPVLYSRALVLIQKLPFYAAFLFTKISIFFSFHIYVYTSYIVESIQNNFWNYLLLCIFYVSYHFFFFFATACLFKVRDFPKIFRQYKVSESQVWLCDPIDYTVHGILHDRKLGWMTIPFSRGSSQPRNQTRVSCVTGRKWKKVKVKSLSHVRLFVTPWTVPQPN